MSKYPSSYSAVLLEESECDFEGAEADVSGLLKGSFPFPGGQYFSDIMLEKMGPKKVAKFRVSKKMESNY